MGKDLVRGAFFVFRGIKLFYQDSRAWKYALPPFLLMAAIYTAVGIGLFFLIGHISLNFLPEWCNGSLRGVMYFFAAMLAFFLLPAISAGTLYEICGGIFFDYLTGYWERQYFSHSYQISWGETCRFAVSAAIFAIKTALLQLLLLILGFFMPVVAQIIAVWVMGRIMSVAIVSSTGLNHGIAFSEIDRISHRNNCLRGFGITAYALSLIPLSIIFFLPGFIVGGTELYHAEVQNALTADHRKDLSAETP